ncbi:MAG: FliG C-terminal domain-containing protein [Pirellulales bacterium]
MKDKHRNLRKAAVLVASLEAERAEAILAQMSPEQAQAVRAAVDGLGTLDPAEQQEVIEEFFRIGPLVPDREPSGIELDLSCAVSRSAGTDDCGSRAAAEEGAGGAHASGIAGASGPLLDRAPSQWVASYLEHEQPQTVAVLLARLSSRRAAELLAALPTAMQVAVARRVAEAGEPDAECAREIERGLESWLRERAAEEGRRTAGATTLARILEAAAPDMRDHIVAQLDGRAPTPPPEPDLLPWRFDELETLDTRSLASIVKRAEPELLKLALAGARPQMAQRVLGLFPAERAAALRRAMCNLGPTMLSDIEDAQQELARLAGELEQAGKISRSAIRHLSVAV